MTEPVVSDAELERVLAGYGLSPVPGENARVVTARVLRVSTTGGELALKIFAPHELAVARVESEVLAHLCGGDDREARVQQLLRTASGEALLRLGERSVLATQWEPGSQRAYHEIDAPAWAALGRTLATLHRRLDDARVALPDALDEIRSRDLARDRETLADHRRRVEQRPSPVAAVLLRLLDDRSTLLERHAVRCQATLPVGERAPIHNDFNVHNYLFHDEGPPTILDWERAVRAPRELEVIRCLNHLPLVAPGSAWAFVEGYLERRPLHAARLAWALDASLRAHALKHWPVELWLAGAPGADDRIRALAEIVRALVEGRDPLDAFIDELRTRTP